MSIQDAIDACGELSARRMFAVHPDGSYSLKNAVWRLELTHVRREKHDLTGQLAIIVPARDGQSEVTNTGNVNVSSVRARRERARYISDLAPTSDLDWAGILEDFCERVLAAERQGQPAIVLRDVPRPTAASLISVNGVTLARQHPCIVFGDGGVLKSLFALWLLVMLEARGLRTLFCDWELSADEHRIRLEQLCGTGLAMPSIRYVRCDRPLTAEADRIARIVRDERIDYVVMDSIAPGCDGPPEAAEVASRYNSALRRFGIGSLCVAHVNRSETADRKPFGSSFWHNLARLTWFVERSEDVGDQSRVSIVLHNRKSNLGALQPSVGFEFGFADDRIDVAPVGLSAVADLTDRAPLWQRMVSALRGGPMTQVALAEALGAKQDSIKKAVDRGTRRFTRVPSADGITRIALKERRMA